jgi:hypothetical protein
MAAFYKQSCYFFERRMMERRAILGEHALNIGEQGPSGTI